MAADFLPMCICSSHSCKLPDHELHCDALQTGRIMANFWEDVDPDEQHFEKLTQSFEEGSTT